MQNILSLFSSFLENPILTFVVGVIFTAFVGFVFNEISRNKANRREDRIKREEQTASESRRMINEEKASIQQEADVLTETIKRLCYYDPVFHHWMADEIPVKEIGRLITLQKRGAILNDTVRGVIKEYGLLVNPQIVSTTKLSFPSFDEED